MGTGCLMGVVRSDVRGKEARVVEGNRDLVVRAGMEEIVGVGMGEEMKGGLS